MNLRFESIDLRFQAMEERFDGKFERLRGELLQLRAELVDRMADFAATYTRTTVISVVGSLLSLTGIVFAARLV
jgi:hypothetical protein